MPDMATPQQVAEAQERMRRAQEARLVYVERPEPRTVDVAKHKRLADELKRCTDECIRLVSELR
jgi:hypothetical protein